MSGQRWQGELQKLQILPGTAGAVRYFFALKGQEPFPLNQFIGADWQLEFTHQIHCIACGAAIKKTYHDGYCFRCYRTLAECDQCIFQPERCHFARGTCRQGQWGLQHCFVPHLVYLAWTSGPKVGITRQENTPTRWLDQGAVAALPILRVASRFHSGQLEQLFAQFIPDKTNWKGMLSAAPVVGDLVDLRQQLFERYAGEMQQFVQQWKPAPVAILTAAPAITFEYPVITYPAKIHSFTLQEQPVIRGKLLGIKGQYLLFEQGVVNIRKHTGYQVVVQITC